MKWPVLLAVAVLLSISGCYRAYKGFYHVPQYTLDGVATSRVLVQEVDAAIRNQGFRRANVDLGPGRALFTNKSGRISVAVDTRDALVTIGDEDHDYETPITGSLRASIEKQLKERYGLTDLKFVRHIDLFE